MEPAELLALVRTAVREELGTASPWCTREEAARYCRIGLRTFDEHASRIPSVRVGARVVFHRGDLDTWLESRKPAPPPAGTVYPSRAVLEHTRSEREREILARLRRGRKPP